MEETALVAQRRCAETLARLVSDGRGEMGSSPFLRKLVEELLPSASHVCLKMGEGLEGVVCEGGDKPCAACPSLGGEGSQAIPFAGRAGEEQALLVAWVRPPSPAERRAAGEISTMIGYAAALSERLARRFGELQADFNALVEATRAISECQDLEDLYDVVAEQGHRLLNLKAHHFLSLMRYSAFDHELILEAASGEGVEPLVGLRLTTDLERATRMFFPRYEDNRLARGLPRQEEMTLTADLVRRKAPWLLVGDVEERDPGVGYYRLMASTRSEIAVPILLMDGTVWGVLNVESPTPHNFSPVFDLPVLQSFARVVAVFVHSLARRDDVRSLDALVSLPEPLKKVIHLSAQSSEPVLLTGETGTGKEVVARALHNAGPRRKAPFIPVNCGAIEQGLLMNELFGHSAHSCTGAGSKDRGGLFHAAHKGTIFLDEAENMPMSVQEAVLRVVERGEVRRVGETTLETVDVRIIAATNVDLREKIARGTFRMDLYYRLKILEITLPPLRERAWAIPQLTQQFIGELRRPLQEVHIDPEVIAALERYHWPGNVRELKNTIKRMMVFSNHLTLDLLPEDIQQALALRVAPPAPPSGPPLEPPPAAPVAPPAGGLSIVLDLTQGGLLAQAERALLIDALERSGGDRYAAAHLLGISPPTIYRKIKEWGLSERRSFSGARP